VKSIVCGIELHAPESVAAIANSDRCGLPVFVWIHIERAFNECVQINELSTVRDDTDVLSKITRELNLRLSFLKKLRKTLLKVKNLCDRWSPKARDIARRGT